MKANAKANKRGLRVPVPGSKSLLVTDVVYSYTVGERSVAKVTLEDGRAAFLRNSPHRPDAWFSLMVPV